MNPELAALLAAIEPYTKATERLTAELEVLKEGNRLLQDVCHQLAVAGGLVVDDSIHFAEHDYLIEQEKQAITTLIAEIVANKKTAQLAKACESSGFIQTKEKRLAFLIKEESDPAKIRALFNALRAIG